MKKLLAILLSASIIISAAACSNTVSDNEADVSEGTFESAAETAVSEEVQSSDYPAGSAEEKLENMGFKGVVYAIKDGEPCIEYTAGTMKNGAEITLDTPVPVGSDSKHICAAAIMYLQEQGKLSVDDKIVKYFPEYENGGEITIRNLLNMTSGIHEITVDKLSKQLSVDNTKAENVAIIKDYVFNKTLQYEPGYTYSYCNANYFLLSNIAEQVSGKDYSELLHEIFFEPLGMTHTGTVDELEGSPDWADGMTYDLDDVCPGGAMGSGDVITSASDMRIWLEALSSGKAISEESFSAMTEYTVTPAQPKVPYGFGLALKDDGSVGHAGHINSYAANISIVKDRSFTMFMASEEIGVDTLQDIMFRELIPCVLEDTGE